MGHKLATKSICVALCILMAGSVAVFATSVKHDVKPYDSYLDSAVLITGDGVEKELSFTVKELEDMTEGHVSAKYTMRTLVEAHDNTYHGIRIDYLLDKAGVKKTAKSAQVFSSDGVSMKFAVDELTSKEYINETNSEKLKAILAFAVEDKPLVKEKSSEGYDKNIENSGGPLRLVIGQTSKGERNSPKFLQDVVKIEVSTKEAEIQFTDIGNFYAWAEEAIYALAEQGVVSGTGDGKFSPEGEVSRAQFATMLTLALGIPKQDDYTGKFSDVKETDWFAPYVEASAAKGLIEGVGGGKFNPSGTINRNQIAVLAVKAMDRQNEAANKTFAADEFKDIAKIPGWALGSASYCTEKKIFDNIAVGYFNGNAPINRAEAAVILYRSMNEK